MNSYKRWFADILRQSLKVRRVAVISGTRQCGKTTLAKQMVSDKVIYKTLDDVTLLKATQDDPQSFIKTTAVFIMVCCRSPNVFLRTPSSVKTFFDSALIQPINLVQSSAESIEALLSSLSPNVTPSGRAELLKAKVITL